MYNLGEMIKCKIVEKKWVVEWSSNCLQWERWNVGEIEICIKIK